MVAMVSFGASLSSQAADDITPVAKVLANPSAFHRHDVVLKGGLKFVGHWEGKDVVGVPTCGPIFKLEDDSGEIPVLYIIRCDQNEVSKVSAMAGGRAIVHATIEAATVISDVDSSEYRTRAMASRIQREEK
jgi:hypothetical protein